MYIDFALENCISDGTLWKFINTYLLITDAEIDARIESDGYLSAKHILIVNDEGDDVEANHALAEELLGRLQNGEDFDTLMLEYTEDPGIFANPDGYTFRPGEMIQEFYDAALGLQIGEYSGIIEVSAGYYSGYHIIKRVAVDVDRESIRQQIIGERIP